jgi:FKBP-type peptidyl-prolyl cis-trans isomerase
MIETIVMKNVLTGIIGVLLFGVVAAQETVTIPAFTAYAVPAEKDETSLFGKKDQSLIWKDAKEKIEFHFYVPNAGTIDLSLNAKSAENNNPIVLTSGSEKFTVTIPVSTTYKLCKAGSIHVSQSGFYTVSLSAAQLKRKFNINIQSLQLSGVASNQIHFNKKERRNAASVHLKYPVNDSNKVTQFYNELKVPKGFDHVHSYYMACGFARGYLGMQVNSEKERRIIFSVWDAGNESVDRKKVADSNKVILLQKGDGVIAEGFGNEGTGGHSHWVYPWTADSTYKFIVTAIPDTIKNTTVYTGYVYLPALKKWKLIASFKAPRDGKYLRNLYSFNENFSGVNGQLERKAYFGNQWIQTNNGKWQELTEAQFSGDATAKAFDRIDFSGGAESNQFFLSNGGFKSGNAYLGDVFTREANKQRPIFDLTKNVDSAVQFKKDITEIKKAVTAKKIDTTGSLKGVYYKIIKEGNGDLVNVTDTVTVFYKGSLLSDGSVFDQTKEKPAVFPLSRLIKGWQIGLPLCKVGGKIQLIIPSGLAYSIRTMSAAIPQNSIMVFDIEVLEAKKKVF